MGTESLHGVILHVFGATGDKLTLAMFIWKQRQFVNVHVSGRTSFTTFYILVWKTAVFSAITWT